MKFTRLLFVSHLLLPVFCTQTALAMDNNDKSTGLASQIAEIMTWWDGDYNNSVQVEQLLADGKPVWREDGSGKGGHIEVVSHYRPVTLPQFGDHVIYVEETKHGDPHNIFRQRIYTLTADDVAGVVRVKLWNFKDKKKYVGAWQDLSRIATLMPDEMFPLPDKCDLLVKRQDNKFHMPMTNRDCAFGENYFNYQVLLGPDTFCFRDKIVRLSDDEVVETAGGFTYHKLNKVQ